MPRFSRDFWQNLLTCAVTGAVVSIFFQRSYGSCGDYPQHFAACGLGVALGLAVNLLHHKILYAGRVQPVLTGFLRYFLGATILSYAMVKIIPVQFPHLQANMDSTFAELLIAAILILSTYALWYARGRYEKQTGNSPVYGVWRMEKMERLQGVDWVAVPESDSGYVERVYLQGEQGVVKGPNRRDRIILEPDMIAGTIEIRFVMPGNERSSTRVWQYKQPEPSRLSITGRLLDDSVRMELALRGGDLTYKSEISLDPG